MKKGVAGRPRNYLRVEGAKPDYNSPPQFYAHLRAKRAIVFRGDFCLSILFLKALLYCEEHKECVEVSHYSKIHFFVQKID